MTRPVASRPQSTDYAEAYSNYINKVPGDDVLKFLQDQLNSTSLLLEGIDETTAERRYAEGKWSVKEVIGHIVDCERVFAYRLLVFARGDHGPLPGFDQDSWMGHANFAKLNFREIASEFQVVRRSTIALLRNLEPEAWDRRGTANNKEMTARAAAFGIAGHTQHHLEILKARYQL